MSAEDMEEEIENLRDQLEFTNKELDTIRDEKDRVISDLEFKVSSTRTQVEAEFRGRMKAVDKEHKKKLSSLNAELDRLRLAFTGDPGGWIEVAKKNGDIYYENKETGETVDTEPENLYIAKAMQRVEEADRLAVELNDVKVKFKATDMKKKEFELSINKLKTEMNSLKTMEKGWKDAAHSIYRNINIVFKQVDSHYDQISSGLKGFERSQVRMKTNIPRLSTITASISKMQARVAAQEKEIKELSGKNRTLQEHLIDKTSKVEKLSAGIEEEIERLCKPMRERMADCMVQVMKAKIGRAQDRREIADLWPAGHFMPTLLMKSRTLSENERAHRIDRIKRNQASMALGLEIRANMTESKQWEIKYDDYGRPFYQHMKTGQTSQEEPEIVKYQPPKGRDEMGNISVLGDASSWAIMCDHKGEVCYKHNETGKVSYFSPEAYPDIPPAKSPKLVVAEAANLVLSFIKSKIKENLSLLNRVEADAQADKKEGEVVVEEVLGSTDSAEELSKYVYDIQTIEMMAMFSESGLPSTNKQEDGLAADGALDQSAQAKDGVDLNIYVGPELTDINIPTASVDSVRILLENLTAMENQLNKRLDRVHSNMKDFSFLLFEVHLLQTKKEARVEAEKKEQESFEKERRREEKKAARREEKIRLRMEQRIENGLDGEGTLDGSISVSLESYDEMLSKNMDNLSSIAGNTLKNSPDDVLAMRGVGGTPRDEVVASAIAPVNPEEPAVSYMLDAYGEPIIPAEDAEVLGGRQALDDQSVTSELTGAGGLSIAGGAVFLAQGDLDIEEPEKVLPVIGDPTLGPSQREEDQAFSLDDVADKLVGLSMYCGFSNLRIDEAPDDVNFEYSFDLDMQNQQADDKWLSLSFFICTTKDRVDAIRENINMQYDSVVGSLRIDPLRSLRLLRDFYDEGSTDSKVFVCHIFLLLVVKF